MVDVEAPSEHSKDLPFLRVRSECSTHRRRKRLSEVTRWKTVGFLSLVVLTLLVVNHSVISLSYPPRMLGQLHRDVNNFQYAVVIDAGSTGSRAFLYSWLPRSGDPHDLPRIGPLLDEGGNPLVKKITPGLSSLENDPEKAVEYIKPLMDSASRNIPKNKHGNTSVYILATAGMRLLEKREQDTILKHLTSGINREYDFVCQDRNVKVISGKQEGIYQWLSVNYVLGNFDGPSPSSLPPPSGSNGAASQRPATMAVIDMGGASMQIAMEVSPSRKLDDFKLRDKEKMVEVDLGYGDADVEEGLRFRLYVKTFLGYGANQALERHRRHLLLSQWSTVSRNSSKCFHGLNKSLPLEDPCLPSNLVILESVPVEHERLASDEARQHLSNLANSNVDGTVNVHFSGTGRWGQCYETIKQYVHESEPYYKPCVESNQAGCPDEGIAVPPVLLEELQFYAFSEFWYSSNDVLNMGGKYDYRSFSSAAKEFCRNGWDVIWSDYERGKYPKSDKERLLSECFKSAWISVALHEGLSFPKENTKMTSAPSEVNGSVVHWTLGALLYRTHHSAVEKSRSVATSNAVQPRQSGFNFSPSIFLICVVLFLVLGVYQSRNRWTVEKCQHCGGMEKVQMFP